MKSSRLHFRSLRLLLQIGRWLFVRDLMQIAPQMNEEGDRYAHDHQRTDSKDQEPPDHPHSATRITEASKRRRRAIKLRSFALGGTLAHGLDPLHHELETIPAPLRAGDDLFDCAEKLRIV
jgi:ABC-type nickel/cobalt efflux system permease component RcnA